MSGPLAVPAGDLEFESPPDESPSFDLLRDQAIINARRRRRSFRELPKLITQAGVLVWRTNRGATAITVGFQLFGAVVVAAQVLLGGYAVEGFAHGSTTHVGADVVVSVVILAVVTAAGGVTGTSGSQLGRLLGLQVERRVTDDILDVSTSVELVSYDDPAYYDQLNRMLTMLPTQPSAIVTALASLAGGVAGMVTLFVTLLVISPVLLVVLALVTVPLWYLSRRGGSLEFEFAVEQTAGVRERDYVVDLLTKRENASEIRAYQTVPPLRGRYAASYDHFIDGARQLIRSRYKLQAGSTTITALATMVTFVALIVEINHGWIDIGEAASAAVAIRLLASRIEQSLAGLGTMFQSALFLDDFRSFSTHGQVRFTQDVPNDLTAAPERPQLTGGVVLDGVSFSYPNSATSAVDQVTVSLAPGEIVALVGENGSGKTTLAKLLAGLYHPGAGTIEWSTSDGGTLSPRTAADQVTLVLQDFLRYQLSAFDNVVLGRPERVPDPEAVHAAAVSAGMDSLFRSLPHGYDTRLSRQFSGGRELSVGQWQRVALARAFYRQGSVVILDEPAAALDPRAEARLYGSVRELLAGRTVVLITHRLRSVRHADRILVMKDGRIVEDGTHDQLQRRQGLYAELTELQSRGGIGR